MKTLTVALSALFTLNAFASAPSWHSVYTDVKADCVVVSSATDLAPIDFYESECKAFAGYRLVISGGDLRYDPKLSFHGQEIDLQSPMGFHDLGSDKIEWLYTRISNEEGGGTIEWKALIYRLNAQNNETMKDESLLYVARLDGAKSCLLGTVRTNEAARALAKDLSARCVN